MYGCFGCRALFRFFGIEKSSLLKRLSENYTFRTASSIYLEKKGEFSFIANATGSTIQLLFSLKINEYKYEPHFYESLKQLMAKVVDVKKNRYLYLLKNKNDDRTRNRATAFSNWRIFKT